MLDESIPVYLILRTQCHPGAKLASYTARLAVNLEVQVYGHHAKPTSDQAVEGEGSPARHEDILWSGSIDTSEAVLILDQAKGNQESLQETLTIWKTIVPLSELSRSYRD